MTVGLLDIVGAAAPSSVEVRGMELGVFGISIGQIAISFHRFPALAKALMGDQMTSGDIDVSHIASAAPEAIGSLIAAGTGHPDDAKHIAAADHLNATEQVIVLEKIFDVTFPGGIGPFVGRVRSAMDRLGAGVVQSTKESATTSPQPSKTSAPAATA